MADYILQSYIDYTLNTHTLGVESFNSHTYNMHTYTWSIETSAGTQTHFMPHEFLFIFTSTLKHLICAECESQENHWSMPFILNIYAGYKTHTWWQGVQVMLILLTTWKDAGI